MRIQLIRNVSVALLAATSMFAQQVPHKVTVQIPFGFHVGTAMMPAGDYTISTDDPSGLVRLTTRDFKTTAAVFTRPVTPRTDLQKGKLIFNRYGNAYFLSRIYTSAFMNGQELPVTKREMQSAAKENREYEIVLAQR